MQHRRENHLGRRRCRLTPASDLARSGLARQLADAHARLGDYPAARAAIGQAQAAATSDTDRASALAALGNMMDGMGDYAEAQTILAQAVPLARTSGDRLTLFRAWSALGGNYWRLGKLDDAKTALNESLTLVRALGDLSRELFALNILGLVAIHQDLAEAERLFTEVHSRAAAAGNRYMAMLALSNLGVVADAHKEYGAMQNNYQRALALAREIGAQDKVAGCLNNLACADIRLGRLVAAREGLREGLTLALRLGALPFVVIALTNFAELAHVEGQAEQALALLGLARHHPAWSSEHQRAVDWMLAEWALDPSVVEAGMQAGESLDWEATVKELLKG